MGNVLQRHGGFVVLGCVLWVAIASLCLPSEAAKGLTALEVFENFRKVYVKTNTFSAEFEETTLMDRQKRTAKGRLYFQKPNLLRQEYLDPKDPKTIAQIIVLDGKTSWSYTPWLNQVTRKEIDPKTSREILPGAGESFEKLPENFSMALKRDDAAQKKGVHLLEIQPKPDKEGKTSGETLEVWIRGSDWIPVQFAYTNKPNDVRTVVTFQNLKLGATPPPDAFVFKIPSGVDVITITDDYKSDR